MSADHIALLLITLLPLVLAVATATFFRRFVAGRRRHGWRLLVAGNGLVLLLIVSCTWLGMELYYRYVYDTVDGTASSKVTRRWFERHWQTNGAQIRDNVEYTIRRQPGKRRVTFVGDSFTAGHGVLVDERFVNRIRQARPDWQVEMLAANGLNTNGETELLNAFIDQGYELDTVVLVYCFNDIEPLVPEVRQLHRAMNQPPGWLKPLVDHSWAVNTHYWRWRRRLGARSQQKDYADLIHEAYAGPRWQQQAAELLKFKGLVERGGGRLYAVTFPWLRYQFDQQDANPAMHARLNEFWSQERVPHLDLLPIYREFDLYDLVVNRDEFHPNALAHELAAEAIIELLDEPAAQPTAGTW